MGQAGTRRRRPSGRATPDEKAKANLDKLLDGRSIVYYASWMDDYKPQMLVDLGYTPTNGPRMHMLPHTFSVDESGEVIRGNRLPGDKYLANCLYYVERAADQLKTACTR